MTVVLATIRRRVLQNKRVNALGLSKKDRTGSIAARWSNSSTVAISQIHQRLTKDKKICQPTCTTAPLQRPASAAFHSCTPFCASLQTPRNSVETLDEKSIEERYSRKTPLEHVLLRPSMYIGSTERSPPTPYWTLTSSIPKPAIDAKNGEDITTSVKEILSVSNPPSLKKYPTLKVQECSVVPALLKVVDEILVNASDHRIRNNGECTRIDVCIYPGSSSSVGKPPMIAVKNNGPGIPVEWHETEQMYVPTLLFGHLMTGSNFDDEEKRVTGGRHGYGAKLTNIFSREFSVETMDNGTLFQQKWWNNMHGCSEPSITQTTNNNKRVDDYTIISFVPDLARLTQDPKATTLSKIDHELLCKRVIDIAGCGAGQVQVTLNGHNVSFSSFPEYLQLYRQPKANPLCITKINNRWEVAVGVSQSGALESVSFVNGMCTTRGGTHVDVLVKQVVEHLKAHVARTDAELAEVVTPHMIRSCLFVAVKALIENPTFDSQMKECLTSSPEQFGSSYVLPNAWYKKLIVSVEDGGPGIVEEVIQIAQGRQQSNLFKLTKNMNRNKRQFLSIPKLEDAHQAGGSRSTECTLILTEGDSAKALAVAGLEIVGRDTFGVFPLRGKLLNVRAAKLEKLEKNAEIKALLGIIGLDFRKEYSTIAERKTLRYGHVLIMADQDTDGSHIKGLVINFFRAFWPKLLQSADDASKEDNTSTFISTFVTPLLKATKKGTKAKTLNFYSMGEFLKWQLKLEANVRKQWHVKYYKGLGTSTPAEAKEYFRNYKDHHRSFYWNSENDGEMLDMVFDKERAADRRSWILETHNYDVEPSSDSKVSYEEFINKEMIHFSNYDNIRSVPNVIDGLKPSQRKVLYACFKRNLKNEIKVAQLSGYCAEHTAYHHGEASLQSTIIGMAQDFVGSNNINLLVPSGQFGTRLTGGTDAASPRYIFTYLDPIARLLFPEVDDTLLQYQEDDGQKIEPKYYCPIIPLLLINGATGIGTGWSTSVPTYKPIEIVDYLRKKLDDKDDFPVLKPFARGFLGEIAERDDGKGFVTYGRIKRISDSTLLIDELPLGVWNDSYKETLIKMREQGIIRSYTEDHTTSNVSFKIKMSPAAIDRLQRQGLEKAFSLRSYLSTTNMHAFGADGTMKRFERAEDVIEEFYPIRLDLYNDRKAMLEAEIKFSHAVTKNKAKFIDAVMSGNVNLLNGRKSKQETIQRLGEIGLETYPNLYKIRNSRNVPEVGDTGSILESEVDQSFLLNSDYDYLLNMPLSTLTSEKVVELTNETSKKEGELKRVLDTLPTKMWRIDLENLAKALLKQ